ncbi:MAG: hypothetical protein A4E49_02821 [Methanosaeta sp. PtaU1.Bin112]|nr:MAG: hypothetical protein A4E49_02821 [Methanosaeta sp. PtaU1.Bin112]
MFSDLSRSLPIELFVGGIKTIIIDPHNHIIPYWFWEFLQHRRRLVAVRIDAHHDMFHCCPALPAREGRDLHSFISGLMPCLQNYSREKVNEGNFSCPAFHYGALAALYHFHPRDNRIDSYGRVSGSEIIDEPKTAERRANPGEGKGRWIVWDENTIPLRGSSAKTIPVPEKITLNDFGRDMQDSILPTAVGFDLDGLYGNSDRGRPEDVIKKRLEAVRKVLERLGRPQFICLARSQTPRSYIPETVVDRAQELALGLINEVYASSEELTYSCSLFE